MKTSKLLVSTVATAALVSAIGFTYAQTSYSKPENSAATTESADKTPAPGGNATGDSATSATNKAAESNSDSKSSTAAASSDSSGKAPERMARADRN
jgi:hypothetical protein